MKMDQLVAWKEEYYDELPFMVDDYHRLTMEHFVWSNARGFQGRVLEVGAEFKKPYIPDCVLLNQDNPAKAQWTWSNKPPTVASPSVIADVMSLCFRDDSFDMVIATETLEHVRRPWVAMAEIYRVLKPGGIMLQTAPFMWPYHGCQRYSDYWRFSADGWRELCYSFRSCLVYPVLFSSMDVVNQLDKIEDMGDRENVRYATAYMVKAIK